MSTETTSLPPEVQHPSITELLARVMVDVDHVGKDGYNKAQNFNFRGIDAVLNRVGPAFRAHGIVPKPMLKKVTYENILVGEKRTPMTRCTVKVKYRFKGPAGDFEDVTVPGEAFDSGDKGTAKAMSVAYRIALIQLLALPTTEPDPDESSYERAPAAVTDLRWLGTVRQRIAAATDHDALAMIGADIGAQADAGQLAPADGDRLRAEFDARWAALTPRDRPAQRHGGPVEDQWNTAGGQQLPPLPTIPEPQAATEPPGNAAGASGAQMKMMHALLRKQNHTKDGGYALMTRVTRRTITSANDLTPAEASAVIHALNTGEIPPPLEPEPAGPNANGEGISEFDVLDQMILDVNSDEARAEVEQAITVEVGRGTITATGAGVLRERLAAHVKQAKAGASA
ncbi:MAG TPA: ERF family protein [Trebonia sp.]